MSLNVSITLDTALVNPFDRDHVYRETLRLIPNRLPDGVIRMRGKVIWKPRDIDSTEDAEVILGQDGDGYAALARFSLFCDDNP